MWWRNKQPQYISCFVLKNAVKALSRLTCRDCQVPGTWRPLNIAYSADGLHSSSRQQHRMNPNQRRDHPSSSEPHLVERWNWRKEGRKDEMHREKKKKKNFTKSLLWKCYLYCFTITFTIQKRMKKKKKQMYLSVLSFIYFSQLNKTIPNVLVPPNDSTQKKQWCPTWT